MLTGSLVTGVVLSLPEGLRSGDLYAQQVAEARAASADRSQPWQGEKELQDWIAAQ